MSPEQITARELRAQQMAKAVLLSFLVIPVAVTLAGLPYWLHDIREQACGADRPGQ